jgi:RND family efflux transporter MFP subunit
MMIIFKRRCGFTFFLFSFFLIQTACKEESHPVQIRPVRAMQVEEVSIAGQRVFPGRTRALNRVNLSFRVSGPLIERPVIVGDKVTQDQTVARIDPRDFEAALKSSEGDLEKTEARLRFAESDYERAETVWEEDPGAVSVSYLDQKREEKNQLAGSLKSIQSKVKSDRDALNDTYLKSPFNGIVVATYVQNFEYVRAEQQILRILDLTEVEIMIDIPESLIKFVPEIKDFLVRFDTYPNREFRATLKQIGTEASQTTRTYPVTLVMKQPEDVTILAGMAAEASVAPESLQEKDMAHYIIPPVATFSDKKIDQTFVWLFDPTTSTVKRHQVEIGSLTSMGLIIKEGLKTGEWVVTSGVNFLSDGEEVKLLPVKLNNLGEQVEVDQHNNSDSPPQESNDKDDDDVSMFTNNPAMVKIL